MRPATSSRAHPRLGCHSETPTTHAGARRQCRHRAESRLSDDAFSTARCVAAPPSVTRSHPPRNWTRLTTRKNKHNTCQKVSNMLSIFETRHVFRQTFRQISDNNHLSRLSRPRRASPRQRQSTYLVTHPYQLQPATVRHFFANLCKSAAARRKS